MVLIIVSFVAGAALMAYSEGLPVYPYLDSILSAAATLAAAFFGASYAFKLQRETLEREAVKGQVEAGNKAIFELVRTLNQFVAVRNQFINEYRENPGRHLYILPMTGTLRVMQLNFDDLSFLFDTESPNFLMHLSMFQLEVASTVDVISQRSKIHVEVIQPTVESLEKEFGGVIKITQIESAIGTRHVKVLKMLTDFMIEGVDGVILNAKRHINEMSQILKKKFPGHKIIGMVEASKVMAPKEDGAKT